MCIAIYVPTGKDITDEQIRNSFSNNKDGAGVMHYDRNGNVNYAKGFMDVESLLAYWKHNTSSKYPRALHCRIATSGKVSKGCCHPFPITDNLDDMLVPRGKSSTGCMMHNGVFAKYTPTDGMMSLYSDTMFFTKKVVYPLRQVLNNSGVEELMSDMTSRVLVFLPNFEVHMYGKWEYEKEHGFYASNDTYDYNYDEWYKWRKIGSTVSTPYSYPVTTYYDDEYLSRPSLYSHQYTSTKDKEKYDHEYGITFNALGLDRAYEMVDKFVDDYFYDVEDAFDIYDMIDNAGTTQWWFYCMGNAELEGKLKNSPYTVFENRIKEDEE